MVAQLTLISTLLIYSGPLTSLKRPAGIRSDKRVEKVDTEVEFEESTKCGEETRREGDTDKLLDSRNCSMN